MKKNRIFAFLIYCGIFLCSFSSILASDSYSIVFIHIGKAIPSYVPVALLQARAFNPDCSIIFIANQEALENFETDAKANITLVSCESLKKTDEHYNFSLRSGLNTAFRDGFFLYTSERFLYLHDLISQYSLKNVFHLENDIMLYVNLEELLPIFTTYYSGIGVTMDNDERCIPGFVYISNPQAMQQLALFFAHMAPENYNDMVVIAGFKNKFGSEVVDSLPLISHEYVIQQSMTSLCGFVTSKPYQYCKNIELFQSIFDAAAIGQYLGGVDPRNGDSQVGYINTHCLFNPALLSYEWIVDDMGRNVPYAIYNNKKFRINNLHIHSKDL